jgi:hypothetical protein
MLTYLFQVLGLVVFLAFCLGVIGVLQHIAHRFVQEENAD